MKTVEKYLTLLLEYSPAILISFTLSVMMYACATEPVYYEPQEYACYEFTSNPTEDCSSI